MLTLIHSRDGTEPHDILGDVLDRKKTFHVYLESYEIFARI